MALYPYQESVAFDPYSKTVAGGVGLVYALSDTNFQSPLPTTDENGFPVTLIADEETGYLPTFYVDGHTEVRFKSGEWTKILVTTKAVPGVPGERGEQGPSTPEALAAAVAAQQAAAEAEALRVLAQQTAGKSAYQLAVDNGFVGTELQWLASLPGASGAQIVDNGTTVTLG